MHLKTVTFLVALASATMGLHQAHAQDRPSVVRQAVAPIPATLQASVITALQRISASAGTNAILIDAVRARSNEGVRSLLIQNGVNANALATVTIDTYGASLGPRKAAPQTLYFAVSTATTGSGTPLGLVYLGSPYGWVDWNTFDPWAYF